MKKIPFAALEARYGAKRQADGEGDAGREQADEERGARAVNQTREIVATRRVCPQRMLGIHKGQHRMPNGKKYFLVAIPCQLVGEYREEDQEANDNQAQHPETVTAKAAQRIAPQRTPRLLRIEQHIARNEGAGFRHYVWRIPEMRMRGSISV